jgi:hypothetical protein
MAKLLHPIAVSIPSDEESASILDVFLKVLNPQTILTVLAVDAIPASADGFDSFHPS